MAVFFIHDVGRRIVTPLPRKYSVREIPSIEELAEISRLHGVSDEPPERRAHEEDTAKNTRNAIDSYVSIDSAGADTKSASASPLSGTIRECMSSQLVTAQEDLTVRRGWELLSQHSISHLPVISNQGDLLGLINKGVLLDALLGLRPIDREDALRVVCEQAFLSTSPNSLISDIAIYMLEHDIDGITVTEHNQLIGLVTLSDIVKASVGKGRLSEEA